MLAKIYRPAKNAMQSGKAGRSVGCSNSRRGRSPTDALMGWTSITDRRTGAHQL